MSSSGLKERCCADAVARLWLRTANQITPTGMAPGSVSMAVHLMSEESSGGMSDATDLVVQFEDLLNGGAELLGHVGGMGVTSLP